MKNIIILLVMMSSIFLNTGCAEQLSVSSIRADLIEQFEYSRVQEFFKYSGYVSSGKSENNSPNGKVVAENYIKGKTKVAITFWLPRNMLNVSMLPQSNTIELSDEEKTFIVDYCAFLSKFKIKAIDIEPSINANECLSLKSQSSQ